MSSTFCFDAFSHLGLIDLWGRERKMENTGVGTPSKSVWDLGELAERNSLGFMELLGVHHDLDPSSLFDTSPPSPTQAASKLEPSCWDAVATPNSSSISSTSSDAVNEGKVKGEDDEEEEEGEEQQEKRATKKQLKPKKINQKRKREPRVAFMTKSEVDHLEDGYRWRKYGQKAVKNSPFPRSYYRCTTATCDVKKRVERSFTDTSIVVTTYEGQHSHPSPLMPRPSFSGGLFSSGRSFVLPIQNSSILSSDVLNGYDHVKKSRDDAGLMVKDHGLLQDLVASHMLKDNT
ncbi:PREDICTED: probable WRKY transcription factor 23 [Tarenaya hassleriana]|uniref:probable WRKY transcription factor 23 n=1 Tax=Tarenaya hassleriana TaxID=28532 RepID=UPI00053CA6C3|nr:PREDICTED: probable WRKY transcription factor 23 [Tarenaya hassleriana]